MEFRLVYEGPLKGAGKKNTQVPNKHAIRKQMHTQLANLWQLHPYLTYLLRFDGWFGGAEITFGKDVGYDNFPEIGQGETYIQAVSQKFSHCGYSFVPLVNKGLDLMCELDILFLRRENPGDLIMRGGDVDNRIKVLLDALRMPHSCDEVVGYPEESEMPFFCLLEDDALVTKLNVTTDRLLRPIHEGQHQNEVLLIIDVNVKVSKVTMNNLELL